MRRKRAVPRETPPDPKYGSVLVQRLINCVMWDGKKRLAEKIVYKAFELIEKRTNQNALTVFETALENVKPIMEVRPRRVGGATYQVPVPVPPRRRVSLAIRWIIQAARARKGAPMYQKLAEELILASRKEGAAYKKKEDTHRMAEANKAFAHFR